MEAKVVVFSKGHPVYCTATGNQLRIDGQLIYEGSYADGYAEGNGTYFADGKKTYEGQFSKGRPHGKGRSFFAETQTLKYEGHYNQSFYEGPGTSFYESGQKRFKGTFKHGLRSG